MNIDGMGRRLGLSLRRVSEDSEVSDLGWSEEAAAYKELDG
jgi:hypothetical protein